MDTICATTTCAWQIRDVFCWYLYWAVQPSSPSFYCRFPRSSSLYPLPKQLQGLLPHIQGCQSEAIILQRFCEKVTKLVLPWPPGPPPWQTSANNCLHAFRLAFWQWAVVGVAGRAMSQMVWTAGAQADIFLFCRITSQLRDTRANRFYAGERQKEEWWHITSVKCMDSRYARLGAATVVRCHLLALVGAHRQGMPLAVRSPCTLGRGEQDLELEPAKLPVLPLATSLTLTLENLFCGKVPLAWRGKIRRKMQP